MPKNAVQRLQKIESDLKTVIHLYDIADKCKNEYDRSEAPEDEGIQQSSLHNSFKKTLNFDNQCPQGVRTGKSRLMAKKPDSAPSSSSALFTICESDHNGRLSSESINNADRRRTVTKKKSFENLKNLDEFNSSNISIPELLMTPSKTLQTANEILAENKYTEDTEIESDCESRFCQSIPYFAEKGTEDGSKLKNQDAEHNVNNSHSLKHNSELGFTQPKKELENENTIIERSSFAPSKKESSVPKEFQSWPFTETSESIGKAKHSADSKKDKSSLEISPKYNMIPKKIPRLESLRSDITVAKNSTKPRSEIKNSQEKTNKHDSGKTEKENQLTKSVNGDINGNKYLKEVKSNTIGKNGLKEKKVKLPLASSDCNNQKKTCETAMHEDLELWVKELSKIIEIGTEKLEKMKFSKELALDIAKHLKNKCDEILESKEKLMGKLQKLEKENEKLHYEIKEAQQSKMKLQLKIEGLKKDSKTKMTDQNNKTKSVLQENIYLKTKICEMERQFNEKLLKKQKEIDQIQKERLEEIKNELKSRENREEDVQRLKKEKSELQYLLNDRYSKMILLEEEISQLQEEIQKQKQNLKKKTERLEETNKELESICENSRDLEEQVKLLRKNIESFDEIQKNLMKQTTAYDQQIKSNEEEIKKLQDENSKLKTELENEKDAQLIKTKIIEDQQESLQKLREKSEDTKELVKRNQSLERILNIEREEKLELQEAVKHLKWRKEELKKKINSLERDLVLAPQEVIRDLKKTQIVLHELENQVQIKQKEWEMQLQSALREKEQACSVAEFATKKLMQITNEFQRQSQAHKRLQIILAENLAEKEKNHRETNEKVTLAQPKQSLSYVRIDDKNTGWSKNKHQNNDDILMKWYFKNAPSCLEDSESKTKSVLSTSRPF